MLQTVMEKWLVLYKKNELKERSYDRLEEIFNNYIKESDLGHMCVCDGRLYMP